MDDRPAIQRPALHQLQLAVQVQPRWLMTAAAEAAQGPRRQVSRFLHLLLLQPSAKLITDAAPSLRLPCFSSVCGARMEHCRAVLYLTLLSSMVKFTRAGEPTAEQQQTLDVMKRIMEIKRMVRITR